MNKNKIAIICLAIINVVGASQASAGDRYEMYDGVGDLFGREERRTERVDLLEKQQADALINRGWGVLSEGLHSYEGEVNNQGLAQGRGVGRGPNGTYAGDWKNGEPYGHGILIGRNNTVFRGLWWTADSGRGTALFRDGRKYKGEVLHLLPYLGRGKITFPNGDKYEGELDSNYYPNGKGIYTYFNGRKYEGEWKDGMKQGNGKMTWPNGDEYKGEWEGDVRKGRGEMIWSNGDKYTGKWVYDMKDGYGTMRYAGGDVYFGDWKVDMRHGRGSMSWYNSDALLETFDGFWKNDIRDGIGVMMLDGESVDETCTVYGKWKDADLEEMDSNCVIRELYGQ